MLHISWQEVISHILVGFKIEQNGFQENISKEKPQWCSMLNSTLYYPENRALNSAKLSSD